MEELRLGSDIRADYLKGLYDRTSCGLPGHFRYLDIGAGLGKNSLIFGSDFREIYCLDISLRLQPEVSCLSNLYPVQADAEMLPFQDEAFDLVSMFSLIEHVSQPRSVMAEAVRVLKPQGELVIQIPNRYSIVEPHIRRPNPIFIPTFLRRKVLKAAGYGWWIGRVDIPSRRKLRQLMLSVHPTPEAIKAMSIVYPPEYIPRRLRLVYRVLRYAGILHLLPLGHLFVLKKAGAQ